MRKTVISDTSCLIILTNIGELDLLKKLYRQIVTTAEVAEEFGEPLPEWIEINSPTDKYRQKILELQIDKGEASAIALALEIPNCAIILDDQKARKVAEKLKLEITGTIGVVIKAKLSGVIPSVKPFLAEIRKTNFRLNQDIEQQALMEADEL